MTTDDKLSDAMIRSLFLQGMQKGGGTDLFSGLEAVVAATTPSALHGPVHDEVRNMFASCAAPTAAPMQKPQDDATAAPKHPHCVVCGKPSSAHCGNCKAVHYCGRDCQVKHWKDGHKHACAGKSTATQKPQVTTTKA